MKEREDKALLMKSVLTKNEPATQKNIVITLKYR